MSVTVAPTARKFNFKGSNFGDPAPSATPDDVRQLLTIHHAELSNAQIEGPTLKDGVMHYTFVTRVGAKG